QFRPEQLGRNQYTDSHPNHTPNDGHDGELAYDFVIVDRMVSGYCRITAHRTFPMRKRKGLRSRKKVYPAQILPTPGASLCAKESVSILILFKLILRDNAPLITDPSRWPESLYISNFRACRSTSICPFSIHPRSAFQICLPLA